MPAAPPPARILAAFTSIYQQAELDLLQALARAVHRGADTDDLTAQLGEARRVRAESERISGRLTARILAAAPRVLADALTFGGREAITDLGDLIGRGRDYGNPLNRGALDNLARSLTDTLTEAHLAITGVLDDAYKRISGEATAGVLTGTATRREASQRALDRFAHEGVTGFVDRSGRRWSLSAYAEMSVRTATSRASVDAHTERLGGVGVTLVMVSNSPHECPLCRPWEGKVLSIGLLGAGTHQFPSLLTDELVDVDVAGSVAEARLAGFMHPNCTHSLSAYLPGVTPPMPRPTENPEGYRARQHLRYLERQVRAAKRVQAVTGPADRAAAGAKVRAWQARIRDHVADTSAKRQPHREQIATGRAGRARGSYVDNPPPAPEARRPRSTAPHP